MAKPIQTIQKEERTEEQQKGQSLESLLSELADNKESIIEALQLLQELHESGILEALNSLLKVKESATKIAVDQLAREPVTNMINNAMAAGSALTELDPESTSKLTKGLVTGLQKADEGLKEDTKIGMIDLLKMMKDPDINRAIVFGCNLLKEIGAGLKK